MSHQCFCEGSRPSQSVISYLILLERKIIEMAIISGSHCRQMVVLRLKTKLTTL